MNDLGARDIQQINELGISEETLEHQVQQFKHGIDPVELISPCDVDNGLVRFTKEELTSDKSLLSNY